METGSLSANTWTKITKIIPGASNVQFNNDTGVGLEVDWWVFAGTSYTSTPDVTLNAWQTFSGSTRFPDHTSTWYTTNDSTFEITGLQLEVGSQATPFEHRSFGEELLLCQRYFTSFNPRATGWIVSATQVRYGIVFPTQMRTTPTAGHTSSYIQYGPGGQQSGSLQGFSDVSDSGCVIILNNGGGMTTNAGSTGGITMTADAEL